MSSARDDARRAAMRYVGDYVSEHWWECAACKAMRASFSAYSAPEIDMHRRECDGVVREEVSREAAAELALTDADREEMGR